MTSLLLSLPTRHRPFEIHSFTSIHSYLYHQAEAYHVYHLPFSFATAQHYSPYCNVRKPTSFPISTPGPAGGYRVDEQPNVPDINNQDNRSAGQCPEEGFYDDRKIPIYTIGKDEGAIGRNYIIKNQYGMR